MWQLGFCSSLANRWSLHQPTQLCKFILALALSFISLTVSMFRHSFTQEGKEPLMIATNVGLELVAMLLDHGANINGRDKVRNRPSPVPLISLFTSLRILQRGYTALMEACHFGNSATVRLLLERGADLNVVAEVRGCCDTRQHVLKQFLLLFQAGDDALIIAAWGGWDDIVSLLVQRGAKLNQYTTKVTC